MSRKVVHCFYDVSSPYSWFAFEVICRYQHRWNISLRLRPFFLGGIFKGADNFDPPPKAKAAYSRIDIQRLAKYFDVPIRQPKDLKSLLFTKSTLRAQRLLTAIDMSQPQMVEGVSRELWLRAWSRDEDIYELESLKQAAQVAGMPDNDIDHILPKIEDLTVKEKLKQTTQEALDLGAFGSPVIVADINGQKEWVFGSDRFPVFADLIGERWEGPVPALKVNT